MGSDHDHAHQTQSKDIALVFVLNLLFALIELAGGILTNSVAIITDAIHDLGDALAVGIAWFFERLGRKGRDASHSYGYRRYPIVGAIVNTIILIIGSILVVQEAIKRLSEPQDVHSLGMIGLALLGIAVNGAAFRLLHSGYSQNKKVLRLHMLEDLLGWIAVLVGAIIMMLTGWMIIDPILSIAIAAFILWNAYKRLRESLSIITQAVPDSIDLDQIILRIRSLTFVQDVHDTHLWTLDGQRHIMTAHIVMADPFEANTLVAHKQTLRALVGEYGIDHLTIEFESADEDCGLQDC